MFVVLLILTLLLTSHNVESKKKTRTLYLLDVRFTKNTQFLKNFEITIVDNTSMNVLLDVDQDLDDIWCNANIFLWNKKQKEFKQFISYDIDLCLFFKRAKFNKANILNAWVTNFMKSGNLSRKCPLNKNLYYVEKLKPDKESIPPFTPTGRCRLVTNIYTKRRGLKEPIGSSQFDMAYK